MTAQDRKEMEREWVMKCNKGSELGTLRLHDMRPTHLRPTVSDSHNTVFSMHVH